MYRIDFCPACGSQHIKKELADLSQFVTWMSTNEFVHSSIKTYAVICNECSFIGSGLRLEPAEEHRIYGNYKSEDYTNKRIFCEPWYKDYIESFDQKKYAEDRKVKLDNLIDKNVDRVYINSVLDVWGGNGEHIPIKFIKAKKYVYNATPSSNLPDVLNFNPSLHQTPIDFIMLAGVLEHQSDPDVVMRSFIQLMNADSWLYVEVPHYNNPSYDIFHEHLNLWNLKSTGAFLNRFGLKIVDYSISDTISILAKVK
jgi:hypothetical protein